MARVAVVGNATHDLIRTGLIATRRPGGTLLYATLALDALGHDVHPIGNAPLRAYWTLRFADVDRSHLSLAFPGTRFLNAYEDHERKQWARQGPGDAISNADPLGGADGILLGPVLGEVPPTLETPPGVPTVLDIQGTIRRLGASNLWGWKRVEPTTGPLELPDSTHVCGAFDEVAPLAGTDDALAAARWLEDQTDRPTVVTRGGDGAVAVDGGPHEARLPPIDVDDPTGAGDVFDAGLLHGLVAGAPLSRAIALGCATAWIFLDRADEPRLIDRFGDQDAVEDLAQDAVERS